MPAAASIILVVAGVVGVAGVASSAAVVGRTEPSAEITSMIRAAAPGARIVVPAGTYEGPIVIDRPIVLVGDETPTIDARREGSVVTIDAPDVTLQGFRLVGSDTNPVGAPSGVLITERGDRAHVADVTIEDSYLGVTVQRATDVIIEGFHVTGTGQITGELHAVSDDEEGGGTSGAARLRGDGVWLHDTVRTTVRDGVLDHVRDGVYLSYGEGALIEGVAILDSRYAIHAMYAVDATIRDDRLSGNLSGAVLMYGGPIRFGGNQVTESGSASTGFGVLVKDAGGVTIEGNVLADNRIALHIDDAGRTGGEPAMVMGNTIAMNQVGVLLFPSADSWFLGNGFLENTTQVTLGGSGSTQAVWTVDGRGNYWSNYGGFDAGGDGVGDLDHVQTGRVDRLIARNPMLLAVASGPAFRLLSAIEGRWATDEPLVRDTAPLVAPPLVALDLAQGGGTLLWLVGAVMLAVSGAAIRGARRDGKVSHRA